jgi:hypothetical protein
MSAFNRVTHHTVYLIIYHTTPYYTLNANKKLEGCCVFPPVDIYIVLWYWKLHAQSIPSLALSKQKGFVNNLDHN